MGIMEGVSGISLGGCIVLVIAFVLHLAGFAAPYWYYESNEGGGSSYFGLWRMCFDVQSVKICVSTTDKRLFDLGADWFRATQAFACLGFIALLVATVFTILGIFMLKDKKMVGTIGAVAALVGAVLVFLAVVIFGAKLNDLDPTGTVKLTEHLHASFGLCVVAFILAAIAGVMLLVGNLKK